MADEKRIGNSKIKSKKMSYGTRYQCPCCGNYTFETTYNDAERCPVCFWSGAQNHYMEIDRLDRIEEVEIEDARLDYLKFGVCDISFLPFVRKVKEEEIGELDNSLLPEELREAYDKKMHFRSIWSYSMKELKESGLLQRVRNGLNNAGWDLQNGITKGKPNIEEAIIWYEKAIKYGCDVAMINLGNIYEELEDYEQAYMMYLEADLAGNDTGTYNVANMYYYGRYVEQNYEKAYKYFKKLAKHDNVAAIFYLGLYAEYGFISDIDYRKARKYYKEAVDLGDAYAATNLGSMYGKGLGGSVDYKKALEYYMIAADRGDTLAYANIGYCYENGEGVKKDLKMAEFYYKKGAEEGDEQCSEYLEGLYDDDK